MSEFTFKLDVTVEGVNEEDAEDFLRGYLDEALEIVDFNFYGNVDKQEKTAV